MPRLRSTPAVLPIAIAAIHAASLLAASSESESLRDGAAFAIGSPDRWLALLGLGFAIGAEERRLPGAVWAALLGGTALGALPGLSVAWPWITGLSVFPYLHMLGPGACLIAGLLLVAKGRWRSFALPVAAFAVLAMLHVTAAINDPTPQVGAFAMGAALASLAMVLAATGFRGLVTGPWTPIGERIAGSWLLAIGLLLSGVQLFPVAAPIADVTPPLTTPSRPSTIPDFAPALRPEGDGSMQPFGGGLPRGTN